MGLFESRCSVERLRLRLRLRLRSLEVLRRTALRDLGGDVRRGDAKPGLRRATEGDR